MSNHTRKAQKALWYKRPSRRVVREFRALLNMSARDFGYELGMRARGKAYDRTTVKHLEGKQDGKFHAGDRLLNAFEQMRREYAEQRLMPTQPREYVIIFSRAKLPSEITALMRARKCRGHKRYCYFKTHNQVYCNSECKKLWRRFNANRKFRDRLSHRTHRKRLRQSHRRMSKS